MVFLVSIRHRHCYSVYLSSTPRSTCEGCKYLKRTESHSTRTEVTRNKSAASKPLDVGLDLESGTWNLPHVASPVPINLTGRVPPATNSENKTITYNTRQYVPSGKRKTNPRCYLEGIRSHPLEQNTSHNSRAFWSTAAQTGNSTAWCPWENMSARSERELVDFRGSWIHFWNEDGVDSEKRKNWMGGRRNRIWRGIKYI